MVVDIRIFGYDEMAMGIGVLVDEREKAFRIRTFTYDAIIKDVWIPRASASIEERTIEKKKGKVITTSFRLAKEKNIPNEIFVTSVDDFFEIFEEMYPDASVLNEEKYIKLYPYVRNVPMVEPFLERGFVPMRLGKDVVFMPPGAIISFCPPLRAWKVSMRFDKVPEELVVKEECKKEYKSFTFVVDGEVYEWDHGKILMDDFEEYIPEAPE
jgi:hypothetical protein